jgi:hypothetical protein
MAATGTNDSWRFPGAANQVMPQTLKVRIAVARWEWLVYVGPVENHEMAIYSEFSH